LRREDVPRSAPHDRRADAAGHVDGHLRAPAPGARRYRRHPVLDGRVREPIREAGDHEELGIDRPYWVQYLDWLRQIGTGDLGKSYRYDVPAWQIVRPLLPVTLELAALSMVFAVLFGVPTGVVSAVRQDSTLDYVLRVFSLAGLSMPAFWLAWSSSSGS